MSCRRDDAYTNTLDHDAISNEFQFHHPDQCGALDPDGTCAALPENKRAAYQYDVLNLEYLERTS